MTARAKETAAERTEEAQRALQCLRGVLVSSLSESKAVDWNTLKDRSSFPQPVPPAPKLPPAPEPAGVPQAPSGNAPKYRAELGFLDRVIKSRRVEKERQRAADYQTDLRAWEAERDRIQFDNAAKLEVHHRRLAELAASHAEAVNAWEAERTDFKAQQAEQHQAIDAFRSRYESKDPEAIREYCDLVLANSEYPDCLPKEFELDFNLETGGLVVNYRLPAPGNIPTLNEVKYVQSSDIFTEKHLSEANAAKL